MPKTNYVPVQGLDRMGGEKPVGVQQRLKAATGPFVPRTMGADGGAVFLVTCKRGDVTLKHIDDLPVQREDLIATEILEVNGDDLQPAYEMLARARAERDRAISVASGYDGTTTGPDGQTIHFDADGTVLTDAEVAALRGAPPGPSLEETDAWWGEQQYFPGADYTDLGEPEVLDLLLDQRPTLTEVEYVGVLERAQPEPRAAVLEVVARYQPGPSPLEEGLPIGEVRAMLDSLTSRTVIEDLIEAERLGKGRRRVLTALESRLELLGEQPDLPDLRGDDDEYPF